MSTDTIQPIQEILNRWILIGQALVGSIGALAFRGRVGVNDEIAGVRLLAWRERTPMPDARAMGCCENLSGSAAGCASSASASAPAPSGATDAAGPRSSSAGRPSASTYLRLLPGHPPTTSVCEQPPGSLAHALRHVAELTPSWWDQLGLLDSTPVSCGASRETVNRSELAGWANYDYCASHSRFF